MTWLVGVLLVLAAINPALRWHELPSDRRQVAVGSGITLAVLLFLGAGGDWILESLDITVPTFRVGVGLVLVIRAIADLLKPVPQAIAPAGGLRSGVVPAFFPVLFRPEVALVGVLVAVDAGIGWMLAGAVLALLDVIWWAGRPRPLVRSLAALFSVGAVVLAIAVIVDGVFAL